MVASYSCLVTNAPVDLDFPYTESYFLEEGNRLIAFRSDIPGLDTKLKANYTKAGYKVSIPNESHPTFSRVVTVTYFGYEGEIVVSAEELSVVELTNRMLFELGNGMLKTISIEWRWVGRN